MKYEVVEATGAWIVRYAGLELARFDVQSAALQDIARRLRDESRAGGTTKLSLRYQPRADSRPQLALGRDQTRISK